MSGETDGERIALERIAFEAEERTGYLNLGLLGLTELPEALFTLKHLKRLNLGFGIRDEGGAWHPSRNAIAQNAIEGALTKLKELPNLRALWLLGCRLASLADLAGLTGLRELSCSDIQVNDRGPLAALTSLRTLICVGNKVSDLSPIEALTGLQELNCSVTQVSDLGPLQPLTGLRELDCSRTQVSDLGPLATLTGLREFDCSRTQVSDLGPLATLVSLQDLDCSVTQVSNLGPLAALTGLQTLNCSESQVSDLGPLQVLTGLRELDFSESQVSDLRPLTALTRLQRFWCTSTQVSDLAPLAGLTGLQILNCSNTQVSDLGPLTRLTRLQGLDCSYTAVGDLGALAGLTSLQELKCSFTQVSDLGPLAKLDALRLLDLSGCRLDDFPRWLLERPSLEELRLDLTHLPGVPAAVLSQHSAQNCLETLRAHVRDLSAGAVPVPDVKLLVLGNGRVGKTQLCRRLRGEEYDEGQASTHGIAATRAPLSAAAGAVPTILQLWDFGGQDLYHGTHALFTRANALFLLVWAPALENTAEATVDGITFRNQPLAYWVDYVRHLGGKRCAVVVVQTRCEQPQDEAPCPVAEAELFAAFGFVRTLHFSARTNRGRATLDEALAEAASWLREQEGIASIGAGRARVKERLEALRDADAQVPPAARQYRTVSQEHFQRLCAEAGGVSAPPHLLEYQHNAGIVFYRPGLFGDQIILDQGWALEAIYTVFHREKCYRWIRRFHGRFTRSDLAEWVWGEHSEAEQKLFLSMMQSCGICFEHRRAAGGLEAQYIAPELLPARAEVSLELQQKWDADAGTEEARFDYALLHPGLIRSIIARIGSAAGIAADYWQGGVYVYETGTGSRVIIEAEMRDAWRGRIVVKTQRGRAAELLQRLCKLVEAENASAGVTPECVTGAAAGRVEAGLRMGAPEATPAPMAFAQEPSPQPEWCVSYAWGGEREAVVDRLCAEAEAQGKTILRDKTAMGLGERISKFMQRIGGAERVFVILSDKYLKSPFCMFELSEVWRNCRQEEEEFLGHIRVYTLPCARIWSVEERQAYARHWETRHEVLKTLMQESTSTAGLADFQEFRLARNLYPNVSDILATVADVLQPRDFEDLVKYGFAD